MPTLGQLYGDNIYRIAYGPQYNAMKYKQALDQSGYIPNENDGLIDSFQSGAAGATGGLFGDLAGWSKEKGFDWVNNNATWAANQMGDIAARNAYMGTKENDGLFTYTAHQAASALGSSTPSILGDVVATAAVDAAMGSVVPGVGTEAGAVVGAVTGLGKGIYNVVKGTRALQYAQKAGKIATGIAAGGIVENLSNAGDTYMTGLSRGMSHEDAWNARNEAFAEGWAPAMLNYASDNLMIGRPMKGIGAAMAVGSGGKVLGKTIGAIGANMVVGGIGEGLTEAWQTQIQEQALKNPEYDGVHIYDPNTWTDEMTKQAEDAFLGSAMLGGIGGSFNAARGYMSNRSNTNVDSESIDVTPEPINTDAVSQPTVVDEPAPTMQPLNLVNDIENIGPSNTESLNLGDATPDAFAPQERGEYDDVFETMGKRFAKNRYTNDEIEAKNQAVEDTVARINDLWDNQVDETNIPNNLKYGDFVEDFAKAGLTVKEAKEASATLVKAMKAKETSTKEPMMDGKSLIRKASRLGIELSDAQKNDLMSSAPIRSNYNAVVEAIQAKEQEKSVEKEANREAQREERKRNNYSKRYENSVNKEFTEKTVGKKKAEETSYRISNAMKRRKEDMKNGKTPKSAKKYLADAGINQQNYTNKQIDNIVSHVQSMQEGIEKRGLNRDELKTLALENVNVNKANETYESYTRKYDAKDPRNTAKIEAVNQKIADSIIEQGKRGKPIYRYDKYKEFKNKNRKLFNYINDAVYGEQKLKEREVASQPVKKEEKSNVQFIKPKFKKGTLSSKIAKAPEQAEAIIAKEQAKAEKQAKKKAKEIVEEAVGNDNGTLFNNEELANTVIESKPKKVVKKVKEKPEVKEQPKQEAFDFEKPVENVEPKKTRAKRDTPEQTKPQDKEVVKDTEKQEKKSIPVKPVPKVEPKVLPKKSEEVKHMEGARVIMKALHYGEIKPNEARAVLATIKETAPEKDIAELDRLSDVIKRNTNDKGELMARDRSENTREREAMIINDRIEKLNKAIEKGATTKEYEREVKGINKLIDRFRLFHFLEDGNYKFKVPKMKATSRQDFLKMHENGEIVAPSYLHEAVLKRPGQTDAMLRKWIASEVGSFDEFKPGEKARHIKTILVNQYNYEVETYGSEEDFIKENPKGAENLAYAIAGSYPKKSFGSKNNVIRDQRNESTWDGSNALTNIKYPETDTLIKFAQNVLNKQEVKEDRTIKKDGRANNGKSVDYGIDLLAVRPGDDIYQMQFHAKLRELSKLYQFLDEIGINRESGVLKIAKQGGKKNNRVTFSSTFEASETLFTDRLYDISGGKAPASIMKARAKVIKAMLQQDDTGAITLEVENDSNVSKIKNRLSEITGETYKSSKFKDDWGVTRYVFYPSNVLKEDAIETSSQYQTGSEEPFNAPRNKTPGATKPITEEQEKILLDAVKSRLGDVYDEIETYINDTKVINVQVSKKGTVPSYVAKTDTIYMPEDRINSSSTSFQHELIHSALRDVLTNQKSPEGALKFAVEMADYIKGEVNGKDNTSSSQRNEMSESTNRDNDSENRGEQDSNDTTRNSNQGSENMPSRSGEDRVQRNSEGLEQASLGESSERRDVRQEDSMENDSRTQGMVQGKNSKNKQKMGSEELLREWNLAEERLNNITEDSLFEDSVGLRDAVEDIISDPIMNVEEKSNKLLPLLWTAKEIDKKFNLDERDSLLRAIYTDRLINLEETMAYTLQGNLSPEHTRALFRTANRIVSAQDNQAVSSSDTLNQTGTESVQEPTMFERVVSSLNDMVFKFDKEDDNITFEARSTKTGNILAHKLKEWLRSPTKVISKYIPQMKPIIYWAEEAASKQDTLQRKYLKALDNIKTQLGEENIASFSKLAREISELGREFVQPASVMLRDKELYINIKPDDIFREFKDELDAKNTYSELKKTGKNVFMDYKDGNFRVFASDEAIVPYNTYDEAQAVAKPLRDKAILDKGYNKKVLNAYNRWRALDDMVFEASVKAWQNSGADPEYKPKRLWGHIPMLHSRYGVYLVKDTVDEDGNPYEKRQKVASFHSYRDAEHWVKSANINGNSRVVIAERNPKYDESSVGTDVYDGDYDSAYDNIVYEGESKESQEQRFARISHSYPEISKIINEFMKDKDHVSREQLMDLLNDKSKQKALGISNKELTDELKYANLDELFRRRDVITRSDIIGHLLIGYGNNRKDKYNNTRTNAEGANPNTFENMENYLRYKAHFIPTQEFYHKSTALYRSVIGTDYASQFGIGGEGARRDIEEVLHRFISNTIGVPNNVDKIINRTANELIGETWIKKHYGDTFVTDLMNRSMEAISIAKLGLFRPTAAIAQLGALMNIGTKTGYGKEFQQALKDATATAKVGSHITFSEQKMFNRIGLNKNDNAMEMQSLKNRKSLYNLKVGKVPLGKAFEKSMAPFNAADKYTRRVAALIAYRKAINEGKTQREAEMAASDFVRETNFEYDDRDASKLFTEYGTVGKLILQFKKYPVKELEFMVDVIRGGNKAEIARFFGSYFVMAGLMGIPGMTATDQLAEWITDKTVSSRIKEAVMEWAGGDPTKKQLALLVMYGTPAPTLGVDFSRNIGVGDLIPTDNFAGPTIGTLANFFNSIKQNNTANSMLLSLGHDLSPAFANYYQSFTGHKRDWTNGVDGREYSGKERVLKGIGFRPVSDAVDSDISQINYVNSQIKKKDKKELIYKYIDDPSSVSTEELKANGITKKNIADAKKKINSSATDKMKMYGSKADKAKNKEKINSFEEFEEDLY
jgi:hypothetical protein|nr:MAG TPA: PLxRFG domain protein [Caudoviricetes sp.]